jgi:hypothetical protein
LTTDAVSGVEGHGQRNCGRTNSDIEDAIIAQVGDVDVAARVHGYTLRIIETGGDIAVRVQKAGRLPKCRLSRAGHAKQQQDTQRDGPERAGTPDAQEAWSKHEPEILGAVDVR